MTTLMVTNYQVHLLHLLTNHSNDGVWRNAVASTSNTPENIFFHVWGQCLTGSSLSRSLINLLMFVSFVFLHI